MLGEAQQDGSPALPLWWPPAPPSLLLQLKLCLGAGSQISEWPLCPHWCLEAGRWDLPLHAHTARASLPLISSPVYQGTRPSHPSLSRHLQCLTLPPQVNIPQPTLVEDTLRCLSQWVSPATLALTSFPHHPRFKPTCFLHKET